MTWHAPILNFFSSFNPLEEHGIERREGGNKRASREEELAIGQSRGAPEKWTRL